jgi:hypothetical protein
VHGVRLLARDAIRASVDPRVRPGYATADLAEAGTTVAQPRCMFASASRRRLERRRRQLVVGLAALDTQIRSHGGDDPEGDGGVDELELRAIERALARLALGRYGDCEACDGPIEIDRLEAVPWTRCCRACVEFLDRELRTIDGCQGCADCARAARVDDLRRAA